MKPELETFLQEAACIPVPYSKSKTLYFDGVGIFIRRDFRGILEVSCVFLLRRILDFSTWLQYNIPYFCGFLHVSTDNLYEQAVTGAAVKVLVIEFSFLLTERTREKKVSVC